MIGTHEVAFGNHWRHMPKIPREKVCGTCCTFDYRKKLGKEESKHNDD